MAGAGPRSSSNQLKPWRGIAARYDKTAVNYRAGIVAPDADVTRRAQADRARVLRSL